MATLNYEDKVAINVNPNIPEKNKVTDGNMNLIKQVGNQILTTMGVYTDNWSSSATYNVDDIAIYDNRIFKNLTGTNTATTPDQDTTNWEETTLASMSGGGGGGGVTGDTLPISSIVPYGSTTAPTNWLVCDGSAVSRTTYADLFAVIGTSFGSGNGTTTFNLPDLRKRVPAGYNSSDTDFNSIGKTGGEKNHTLTTEEMPSHKHNLEGLIYALTPGGGSTAQIGVQGGTGTAAYLNNTMSNVGGGQAHNNLQPYQVVCYIIKAKQSAGVVANVSNTYSTSQSDTYSCDYVNKTTNYSTTEQVVGKWVDGKPIYRKVISGITETEGTFDIETISTNVKQAIKVDGFVVVSPMNLPISYSNTGAPIYYFIDGNDFKIQVGNASFAGKPWYATIEYTKTTD